MHKDTITPSHQFSAKTLTCSDASTDLEVKPLFGCHWEKVMFVWLATLWRVRVAMVPQGNGLITTHDINPHQPVNHKVFLNLPKCITIMQTILLKDTMSPYVVYMFNVF